MTVWIQLYVFMWYTYGLRTPSKKTDSSFSFTIMFIWSKTGVFHPLE